jgi:hypothetical protein
VDGEWVTEGCSLLLPPQRAMSKVVKTVCAPSANSKPPTPHKQKTRRFRWLPIFTDGLGCPHSVTHSVTPVLSHPTSQFSHQAADPSTSSLHRILVRQLLPELGGLLPQHVHQHLALVQRLDHLSMAMAMMMRHTEGRGCQKAANRRSSNRRQHAWAARYSVTPQSPQLSSLSQG